MMASMTAQHAITKSHALHSSRVLSSGPCCMARPIPNAQMARAPASVTRSTIPNFSYQSPFGGQGEATSGLTSRSQLTLCSPTIQPVAIFDSRTRWRVCLMDSAIEPYTRSRPHVLVAASALISTNLVLELLLHGLFRLLNGEKITRLRILLTCRPCSESRGSQTNLLWRPTCLARRQAFQEARCP